MNYSETSYGGLLVEEIDVNDVVDSVDVLTIDAVGNPDIFDSESVGGNDDEDEEEEDDPMGGEDDDDDNPDTVGGEN